MDFTGEDDRWQESWDKMEEATHRERDIGEFGTARSSKEDRMTYLKELKDAKVISIVFSKFRQHHGDGNLTLWKQPSHFTLEIRGRRGGKKAQLFVTFAAAREMAQEILDATS